MVSKAETKHINTPPTPIKINEERFNYSRNQIKLLNGNYRGCWHLTCPQLAFDGDFTSVSSTLTSAKKAQVMSTSFHDFPGSGFGYVSRLLLAIAMLAVSQACSPESEIAPLSSVKASAGQYPPDKADGSDARMNRAPTKGIVRQVAMNRPNTYVLP